MTSRMAQNGGINLVGKYELRGKLGEGNMATVFNAWDPELEREVAIKMLKPAGQFKLALDPDELAVIIRFRDSSYQQSASCINAMQKLLQDEGINRKIEMHHGSKEDE
jgi:serine/threonine protein kinase